LSAPDQALQLTSDASDESNGLHAALTNRALTLGLATRHTVKLP
jgi:hypothetical protein